MAAQSQQGRGRHRGEHRAATGRLGRGRKAAVAAAVVLGAVLAGALMWTSLIKPQVGGDSASGGSTDQGSLSSSGSAMGTQEPPAGSPSVASPGGSSHTALAVCAAEVSAAESVVAAARTGIGHWAEHVQARTDLLSGAQPEAVTRAIWKRTREAGPADLARYQQAVAEQTRSTGGCARAIGRQAADSELVACRQRLEALTAAAAAGAGGMQDWKTHQEAMAAHKAGEIDAAHAQHLWVAAWAAAPKNITAFRSADAVLRTAPACQG